jgi:hypothetical protein
MNNLAKSFGIAQRDVSSAAELVCESDRDGSIKGWHRNLYSTFAADIPRCSLVLFGVSLLI